jgi:hypothetical protein
MSIVGVGSHIPSAAGGGSPAGVMAELIEVLREARQTSREREVALSDAAIVATEDRARLASDKAEAARSSAYLQFALSAGQAAVSICSSVVRGRYADTRRADQAARVDGAVQGGADQLAKLGTATDDAFGFGHRATALEADMERASSLESRLGAHADRARLAREDLDEALADVRQAYRDLTGGQNGGA